MPSSTLLAYVVSFTASFFIMVIELVAGRILAPYIGMHLYSWTSIIGVCLAGISIGAWLGGWLADRFPRRSTLGWILFLSGVLALIIPIVADTICNWALLKGDVSLMLRIVIYTAIIFLPVAILLGMVSPVVVKLQIQNLSNAGSTVGRIYAFSTLGSILGTFATGFILIEEFGTRPLLYVVGAVLIVIAPLVGGLFGRGAPALLGLLGLLLAALVGYCITQPDRYAQGLAWVKDKLGKPLAIERDKQKGFHFIRPFKDYEFYNETNYFTIKVVENATHRDRQTGEPRVIHDLILDNLIHSHSDPTDPGYLAYDYLRIYEELVGWQLQRKGSTKHQQLFIGGGGYTLQRMFNHRYKDCHIDVAEIDPGVTKAAEEFLYAPKNDSRLVTYNVDGRLFVLDQQKTNKKYEFIFGDAFNDLSIPFHLTTKEFNAQLRNLLTPDGLLMSLVIDHVGQGQFLPSFLATMRAVFGDDNVVLIIIEKANRKEKVISYLKEQKLDEFIAQLETKKLEEVIPQLKAKGVKDSVISELELKKADEFAPYIKPVELDYLSHNTVIVVASPNKQDWGEFRRYLDSLNQQFKTEGTEKETVSNVHLPADLTQYLNTRMKPAGWIDRLRGKDIVPWKPVILTDDYAPVDNLTAPMFEKRYGFKKKKKDEEEDE
jgi:spermidine synthase